MEAREGETFLVLGPTADDLFHSNLSIGYCDYTQHRSVDDPANQLHRRMEGNQGCCLCECSGSPEKTILHFRHNIQ